MSNRALSEKLTDFVSNLKFSDIPADALRKAKCHVLDAIGICLAVSKSETTQTVKNAMAKLGDKSESTVIGSRQKFSAPAAAMTNSAMAHGPDFDDTHQGSVLHISSVVVPTSLAVSESVGASGKDFITGVMAGYETTLRLGLISPGVYHARGFHATALLGGFGAVLMTSKLKRLSPSVTVNALGIAGSQAAGIIEFLSNGSSLKQMQPGWACFSGIMAAMLAEEGMTGPTTVFEGRYGFLNSYLPGAEHNLNAAVDGLGVKWEVNGIALKSYPCCHYTQAFLDCAKEMRNQHDFRLEDVDDIECIIHPKQADVVCIPLEEKFTPKTPYDAKFSLPYLMSVMLHRGKVGLQDFTENAISEEGILQFSRKVRYTTDDKTGFPFGFPGWVKIKLKDGRMLELSMKTNHAMTEAETIGKFEDNASIVLPSTKVKQIAELVMNVENVKNIREITDLCVC